MEKKYTHPNYNPTNPFYADEEWLKWAINELENGDMTPEARFQFARITAQNAEVVHAEKRKLEEVKLSVTTKIATNLLRRGIFTVEEVAEDLDLSAETVLEIKQQLDNSNL